MKRLYGLLAVALTLAVLAIAVLVRGRGTDGAPPSGLVVAPPVAQAASGEGARAAVARSVSFLQEDGEAWMEGRLAIQNGAGCVSCHQVPFGLWGLEEARRVGVAIPEERFEALSRRAREFAARPRNGSVMLLTPMVLGRPQPAEGDGGSAPWDSFAQELLAAQFADGHWEAGGQFPSQNRSKAETDGVATLWTMLALSTFESSPLTSHTGLERSFGWLTAQPRGTSTEWLAVRLLAERAAGDEKAAQRWLDELVSQQRADGGWGWLPDAESNAFSTGQVLYALTLAGVDGSDPAIERGVSYLLASQGEDGSWKVPSLLTSHRPGPGNDYVYRYWGTAWAVIGLSRTVPRPAGG